MATSTFERKIEITSPDALKKLVEVSKDLLKQWLSRSKH